MKQGLIIRVLAVAFSLSLGCAFVVHQANKPARHATDTPRTVLPGSKSSALQPTSEPFDASDFASGKKSGIKSISERELMPSSKSAPMFDPAEMPAPSPPTLELKSRVLMSSSKVGIFPPPQQATPPQEAPHPPAEPAAKQP